MKKRPTTEIPPKGAPCLLFFDCGPTSPHEDRLSIGHHDGDHWIDAHAAGGADPSLEGWALIEATPLPLPPNTKRVRIVVDVSPLIDGKHRTHVRAHTWAVSHGWRRSIVVADVPVPEPIAEIVGAVEVP